MYPCLRFIRPDPEEHSGQLRLQIFVSSVLDRYRHTTYLWFPVTELFRYEYPACRTLAGLIKIWIIDI